MDALFEHDARGPVKLAHHDALRAVDDERAQLGQQREVTEVDFLFDDVPRPARTVLQLLPDDQP